MLLDKKKYVNDIANVLAVELSYDDDVEDDQGKQLPNEKVQRFSNC